MASHGIPRVSGARERDGDKEKQKITAYRDLVSSVHKRIHQKDFSGETLDLTSKLLVKNPEYYTIWNLRRRLLQDQISTSVVTPQDAITNDLQFLVPLLVQFPKCYWIWNYRMWLLDQAEKNLELTHALQIWEEELGLVSKMLLRDERNFHGWSYRRHVVAQIEKLQATDGKSLVESEFMYTTRMITKALQNFSALHYRSKLIPRLLRERNASEKDRREFLQKEFTLMQDALIDPFNQSAWFYHQYLMSAVHPDCSETNLIATDLTTSGRKELYEQEIERIKEILEDFDDCKWVYQALLQYSSEYVTLFGDSLGVGRQTVPWLQRLRQQDPARAGRWTDMVITLIRQ